jgi:hypothetical protein
MRRAAMQAGFETTTTLLAFASFSVRGTLGFAI